MKHSLSAGKTTINFEVLRYNSFRSGFNFSILIKKLNIDIKNGVGTNSYHKEKGRIVIKY